MVVLFGSALLGDKFKYHSVEYMVVSVASARYDKKGNGSVECVLRKNEDATGNLPEELKVSFPKIPYEIAEDTCDAEMRVLKMSIFQRLETHMRIQSKGMSMLLAEHRKDISGSGCKGGLLDVLQGLGLGLVMRAGSMKKENLGGCGDESGSDGESDSDGESGSDGMESVD